jgi:hypothetical protein
MREEWNIAAVTTNMAMETLTFTFINIGVESGRGDLKINLNKKEVIKAISPLVKKAIFDNEEDNISVYK